MTDGPDNSNELNRQMRARNLAIALTLAGLVVLFFVAAIVKMQEAGNAG